MSKAEKYIKEHRKNNSNEVNGYGVIEDGVIKQCYIEWVTFHEALKAVEIAREEIYEWLSYHLDTSKVDVDYKFEVIEELRKTMKDE